VATDAETIGLFDLQAGMRMGRIDAGDAIDDLLFLGFDRLGRQLAAITRQGTVMTWNPKTQRQIRKLTLRGGDLHGSRSVIHAAATRRASSVFVVGLQEVTLPTGGARRRARPGDLVRQNRIIAYDWNTGLEVKRVEYPDGPPRHLVLGPGTNHVVAIPDEDPRLNLVHLERGEIVSSVPVDGTPTALTLSEDDQWLGAGTEEGHVVVWTIQRRGPPEASDQEADLPSLSGRIRVLSKKTPAIPADTSADLAVLPFQSRGDSTQIADMCSNVLTSQLASAEHLTLLERERIDEILSELQLQASDLTQSDGARIGRLLNADYLILGSLNVVDTTYLFNARLLRVETSEITAGRRVICEECEGKDIFDALHLLGTTIAE
jgi:TolB-like protein